jgi:hypothetical protein
VYRFTPLSTAVLSRTRDMRVPDAEHVDVPTAPDLARLIAGCRACVGGRSCGYAIADALKMPRLLEVCGRCPNVIPQGPGVTRR